MPKNEKYFCICMFETPKSEADKALASNHKAAVLSEAKWDKGAVVTCRFIGGSDALQKRVKSVAKEWEQVANLTLDFQSAGPTDIRIDFIVGDGSWSYLGTVCRQIPEPDATMNYGWLEDDSPEDELRRVVLHEFGHALGLIHEHQNPKGGIQWNRDAVIADLSGEPNNWDLATIENNIFRFYPLTDVIASDVDKDSIMMYPIPLAWTNNGFSAGLNSELSPTDKILVGNVYPK